MDFCKPWFHLDQETPATAPPSGGHGAQFDVHVHESYVPDIDEHIAADLPEVALAICGLVGRLVMVGDPELGTLPGEFRLAPAPGLGKMKHVKARVISPDEPI